MKEDVDKKKARETGTYGELFEVGVAITTREGKANVDSDIEGSEDTSGVTRKVAKNKGRTKI